MGSLLVGLHSRGERAWLSRIILDRLQCNYAYVSIEIYMIRFSTRADMIVEHWLSFDVML